MIDFHTLASKLDSKGYRDLRRLSALDWYIQFAVRRDCFEFARRWNRDHDEYSRPYPQQAKALEMIRRKPIVSIPDIVNSGFRLSDFFELACFFVPDANGQYDIHRPAQPILHRHLPRLRLAFRKAAQESFRRALGTSLSDQTIMKLADEWMSGKCELPQLPDSYYNKPITSTDFGDGEFLRIDSSASDKDIVEALNK
jgi:hypothetical protein